MNISVVGLTSELVKLHPLHRSPAVGEALDVAAHQLKRLGLDCDIRPHDGARQLIATHAFGPDGPHVIVNGHIDIEDVADKARWSAPELWRSGQVRAGRVYGAGSSDMLGGVASLIGTVGRLADQDDGLTGRVTLQLVVGRHRGGAGTRALFDDGDLPDADLAVVAEPTDRHVCTTAYGFARYRLRAETAAGPMAFATDRKNAGTHAAIALLALDSANRQLQQLYPTRQRIRYVLPGVIRAGQDAGTPATESLVEFAVALPPLLPHDTALDVVDSSIRSRFALAGLPLPEWEADGPMFPPTSLGHDSFADLLREVNGNLRWCQYPCPSDAWVFQDLGIPVVVYGPGDLARTKRPDEYVEVAELHECVETLSTALIRWLSPGGE